MCGATHDPDHAAHRGAPDQVLRWPTRRCGSRSSCSARVTIPLMLASPSNIVLSVRIWTLWETGQYGAASALGVVMFTVSGAVLLIVQRFFRAQGLFETRGN